MISTNRAVNSSTTLRREVGLFGAVIIGLGSIVGTGAFVTIAIGAIEAGPALILAIVVAAVVAICNGLSSAQLAAAHPVSGGTYEYGYRWLNPSLGFTAGWMFLCAKSASAATAALGIANYLGPWFGLQNSGPITALAVLCVIAVTLLVCAGMRRTNFVNIVIVSATLAALLFFVLQGFSEALLNASQHFSPFFVTDDQGRIDWSGVLYASALMFVAFTGYGRIATMAEEVIHPDRTIPIAIVVTLTVAMGLYTSVAFVAIAAVGAESFGAPGETELAPLVALAGRFGPTTQQVMFCGGVTAMLGVLLNLVLGLSRVVLAMGRRGDIPRRFGQIHGVRGTPQYATLLTGVFIVTLVLIGDMKTTWSFSAFTVLVYYAITNLALIRMPATERRFPAMIAWLGLLSCGFLAFWVELTIILAGSVLIFLGLLVHWIGYWRHA
jgi:APA family basic amino acid/polyamine antiporter